MENNENKEVINLTDEELKEVTGGIKTYTATCELLRTVSKCKSIPFCQWENGKCVAKD